MHASYYEAASQQYIQLDAAYCYRRSSVVCISFCVCVSVTFVSPAKTYEPIEMRVGSYLAWTQGTIC